MKKIKSFTVDHLRLVPGVYVSRVDYVNAYPVTTFDLRMTSLIFFNVKVCSVIYTRNCNIAFVIDKFEQNFKSGRFFSAQS